MNAIEARGLRKVFGEDVVAVDGIDLEVGEGQIVGFLGPNRAGKTTTPRRLVTLLRPTSGTARVAGLDVVADAGRVRRAIGVALQEAGLDAMSTGREQLELQARLHGFGGAEVARRAGAMLELVGLAAAADRRVGT